MTVSCYCQNSVFFGICSSNCSFLQIAAGSSLMLSRIILSTCPLSICRTDIACCSDLAADSRMGERHFPQESGSLAMDKSSG